jgi:hypothetical protein
MTKRSNTQMRLPSFHVTAGRTNMLYYDYVRQVAYKAVQIQEAFS